jgi:nitrogen regulatory protein P-II 1
MKELDIIIPHEQLGALNEILYKHKVGGMYFTQITGRGRAEREAVEIHVDTYKTGRRYVPEFGSRTLVVVVVGDPMVKPIVDEIFAKLSTGQASDGKVFVKDIAEAFDIGTKVSGDQAA